MKKLRIYYNGKVHEVGVEEIIDQNAPQITLERKETKPQAAMELKPQVTASFSSAPGEGEQIETPMPGRIVSINAAVGQSVQEGDTIMVIEAMKMENEIVCESSGVVREIRVKVDDMVDAGHIVAVVG